MAAVAGTGLPSARYSNKYGFRVRSETPEIALELSLQPWRVPFLEPGVEPNDSPGSS